LRNGKKPERFKAVHLKDGHLTAQMMNYGQIGKKILAIPKKNLTERIEPTLFFLLQRS